MTEVEKYIAAKYRTELVKVITEFAKDIKATKRADLGLIGDVVMSTYFSFLDQVHKFLGQDNYDKDFETYVRAFEKEVSSKFAQLKKDKGID